MAPMAAPQLSQKASPGITAAPQPGQTEPLLMGAAAIGAGPPIALAPASDVPH